jgi:hypothetical protein
LNYKETLFFIAKCLTISLEDNNRQEIEKQLQSKTINWETIVEVSTAHYVFPAIYCNLKRADFLHYLPQELVNFMEHITSLNRERNQQIITQAKDLNTLLSKNNITPIFLKGTGNLLAGIYDDIAERMVGDIDFIFSKEDYSIAITILRKFGYSEVTKQEHYPPYEFRHYRRLQKENRIAAIEIHSELLCKNKYANEFNYNLINKDSQIIKGITVSSYSNKLNLSIIAFQINNDGFKNKTMALRNAYDVYLLSKKTNAKDAVNKFDKLSNPLNCFLAACYEIFNKAESLKYNQTKKVFSYLSAFDSQFINSKKRKRQSSLNRIYLYIEQYKFYKIFLYLKRFLCLLKYSILHKKYRVFMIKTLTNKNWYNNKLIEFGLKK